MRLLFLLLVLVSSLQAQEKRDNIDAWQTIVKGSYSLQYPQSWAVDTSKAFGIDLLLRSPKTDSLDEFSENMNLFAQDLHGHNYTLSRMGKDSEAQIKNMVTDAQIIESRLDSTSSPQCYILQYKGRQGKFSLITIQHYYFKNDIGYALTMTIQQGKEQDYALISDKIFNSFSFLQ